MDKNTIRLFGSNKTDNWQTPAEIWTYLKVEFGAILFDPCPLKPGFDGLAVDWKPVTFVNPPYSQVKTWLIKAHQELKKGNCHTVIFLTFANTETVWFQDYILPFAEIRFLKGRVSFINEGKQAPAMRPSILIIFRSKKMVTLAQRE